MLSISDFLAYKEKMLATKHSIICQLKKYPKGNLRIYQYNKGGKRYTTFKVHIDGKHPLRSITKNHELVTQYAEKEFLTEKIKLVEHNIQYADSFITTFEDLSPSSVIQHVNPLLWPFLAFHGSYDYALPSDPFFARKIIEWMKIPCPKNTYYPEELKHRTTAGCIVRSKSEAVWAEKLKHYRLPFKYEFPLHLNGEEYRPDFTVMRQDGKMVYIEHCGLMIQENYMRHFQKKMQDYYRNGIVLWDNLILTFDDSEGRIDVNLIDAEINNKILSHLI